MLTSKQRAYLRGCANKLETILTIGKDGVTPTILKQANDALLAREMIKARVLENCQLSSREVAEDLAAGAECDIVQVIGSRFVLYRRNPKNIQFEIDKL